MGLFRDQESELSALQRLVARLKDSARRAELPAAEWPMAMAAYGLHMSADPALLQEGSAVYEDFKRCAAPAARLSSLTQLAQFVTRQRGKGWQALLLYAMGEDAQPALCARAATLAATLAPPAEGAPFAGVCAVVQLLAQESAPPAMLGALLALSDTRLLPALQPLSELPSARRRVLLAGVDATLNSLSAAFLLQQLETDPALAEEVTNALCRMAAQTPLVADIAMPIPTWQFAKPIPQPLHAWSLPEYLPRMLPRLRPHLSPLQIESLQRAFV